MDENTEGCEGGYESITKWVNIKDSSNTGKP